MLTQLTDITPMLEATLAKNISGLTTEFRNYEAADLIALIKLDRMATLGSLLDGECEMFFRPETMCFGGHAEVLIGWNVPPTIHLAMMFRNQGVELYYRLTLEAAEANVQIDLIRFGEGEIGPVTSVERLDQALRAARRHQASVEAASFR